MSALIQAGIFASYLLFSFYQPAYSTPLGHFNQKENPSFVVKVANDFPQKIKINRRGVRGKKWEDLHPSNGTGTFICWVTDQNHLCFGVRCGNGRETEIVHLFSGGDFQTGRRFPVYVDGELITVLTINALDPNSQLVTSFDPDKHWNLLKGLKAGSTVTVGYDSLVSFSLKGSSKALNRIIRQCNIPERGPTGTVLANDTSQKQIVQSGNVSLLYNTDLEGGDYRNAFKDPSLQGISQEACTNLCIQDRQCKAYTYNTKRNYCFLKDGGFVRKPHRLARSGIITGRKLFDAPAANSRFSKNAIHDSIRRIVAEYKPEATNYDYSRSDRAASTLIEPTKNPEMTDVGELLVRPWLFKRYNDKFEIKTALSGAVTPYPNMHLFLNTAHYNLMRRFKNSENKYGAVDQPVVRDIHAGLLEILNDTVRQFGNKHPRIGVVMTDIAKLTNYLAYPKGASEDEIQSHGKKYLKAYHRAATFLRSARSNDPEIQSLIDDHFILTGVLGSNTCKKEHNSIFHNAIVRHRAINGDDIRQIGWLGKLAKCEENKLGKRNLLHSRIGISRKINDPRALVSSLIDLARDQIHDNDKFDTKNSFREAFRIFHRPKFTNIMDIDFITYGDFGETETWKMLQTLGLDAELDLYLASTINKQIDDNFMSNNVGISWVYGFSDVLEGIGRYKLADQYYTSLGVDDTIPSPVGVMVSIADERMDREKIGVALHLLNRALPIARDLGKQNEEFRVLASLARAHHERGDFGNALKAGREAIQIFKGGLLIGREEKWKHTELQTIIANVEAEQADRVAYSLVLAEQIKTGLDEACRPGGNIAGFPRLPRAQLLEDPALKRAFLETDAVSLAIECFNNNLRRLAGIYAGRWKSSGNYPMQSSALADAVFIMALSNDLNAFNNVVEFLTTKADWTYKKSNSAVLKTIFPDRLKKEPRAKLLRQSYGYAGSQLIEAYASVIRGLAEAGKAEWLEPFLERFVKNAGPKAAEKLIQTNNNVSTSLPLLALDLHSIGKTELAHGYYKLLKPLLRRHRFNNRPDCDSVEECEFLAFFDDLYGDRKDVITHLNKLAPIYVMMNTGASVSSAERDQITNEMLLEGKRHERNGRFKIAEAYYKEAGLGNAEKILSIDDPIRSIDTIRTSASLARVAHKLGDNERALKITTHFVSSARKKISDRTMLGSDSIIRWSHRLRDIFETHLDAANASPDGTIKGDDNHYLALQYLQATRTADTVAKLSARKNASDLVKKQQEIGEQLSKLHSRLYRTKGDRVPKLLQQISNLEAENSDIVDQLEEKDPEYLRQKGFRFPNLVETQAQLRAGESLLLAFTGRDHTYLWLVNKETNHLIRSSVSPADVEVMVRELRKGVQQYLETPAQDIETREWNLEPFYAPYRELVAPFKSELEGTIRLIFVPNGAFDSLPVGALLTSRPPSPKMKSLEIRNAKLPWLIRKYAVNVLPSVSAMESLVSDQAVPSDHEKQFLGIGNPDFSSGLEVASLPTRTVSTQTISVPPLPDTANEVKSIAEIFGNEDASDLMLSADANEKTLKEIDLSRYAIINFATHGVLANEIPGIVEPALILATPSEPSQLDDGLLKASEISALNLNADLVMLSACNTAGSDGTPGAEGLSGLAKSFFYAGARGLIVTHWEIPSKPAVDLAVGTIRSQKTRQDRDWAVALKESVINLIDKIGDAKNAHPAAWGAHMVVGMR